jgi:biopolymer transport protein ExbD
MDIRPVRPWLIGISLTLLGSHAAFHSFRVSAWTELKDYEFLSLVVSVICLAAGCGSLTIALASTRPAIAPTSLAAQLACPRLPLRPRFHRLPQFGLIGSFALFLVIVPMWIMDFGSLPSKGLSVDLVRSDLSPLTGPETIILRIDARNRWYLNGVATSPSGLPNALKVELSRRAKWLVYVGADPDVPYAWPIAAMEIVRASHARVILLTPASTGNGTRKP